MDKEKKKVEELEASLAHEEDVLEEIRDSLKGGYPTCHVMLSTLIDLVNRQDAGLPRQDRGQAEGAAALDGQDQCEAG